MDQSLRIVQVGKETTWGTPVAPTVNLMGVQEGASITPVNETEVQKQLRGTLYPGEQAVLKRVSGEGKLPMLASYEDILYIIESAMGIATPSGAGPYVRDYAAPGAAAAVSPRMMTYNIGPNGGSASYRLQGAVVNKFTIKGNSGENIEIESDLIGEEVDDSTLTVLSSRTVNPIMGHQFAVYVDPLGGTIGTTVVAGGVAWSFELAVDTARKVVHPLGYLRPARFEERRWAGSLKLKLLLDATAQGYLTALAEQTGTLGKLIRLIATDTTRIFRIDFAGVFVDPPEIYEAEDDILAVEFNLDGIYDSPFGNWLKIHSENGVAAIA